MSDLLTAVWQHLAIVSVAIVVSAAVGVLLGVASYWVRPLGGVLIWPAEMIQTIPSLALLAMLMILFGLGNVTMVVGLMLYALLPIIRNTHTGLTAVPSHICEAAKGMGMSRVQRLLRVEIPMALPMIFGGVKIALVNSLSIAVMGVLIGADGLGYIIYRGIQQRDLTSILVGAIPVVLMALAFDFGITRFERSLSRTTK